MARGKAVGGVLELALPVPALPPGLDSLGICVQTAQLDGASPLEGGPSYLTIVGPGL